MTNERDHYHRNTCYFCGHGDNAALEKHHIVPRRHDGGDEESNMVTVCANCHRKLESLYDESFYAELGVETDSDDDSEDEHDNPYDAAVVDSQRECVTTLTDIIESTAADHEHGAPMSVVVDEATEIGVPAELARSEIEKLKTLGEVYEPMVDYLRTT